MLALSGVISVAYIAVQLHDIADKAFFLSVITAFLAPTVTALLAILRTEALNKIVNGHFPHEKPAKRKRSGTA